MWTPPNPLPWNAGAPQVASSLQVAAAAGGSTETQTTDPAPSESTEMVQFGAGEKKAKTEEHQGVLMEGKQEVWDHGDEMYQDL